MKVVVAAALLALVAPAAWAEDFDLGFARPGMTLDEFRAASWPPGLAVRCLGEADLPPESDDVRLSVPQPVARLGGTRCGLFRQEPTGWRAAPLTVAGADTQVWGKFFPDRAGAPRLLHLVLRQPAGRFAALADAFTERFGPPDGRRDGHAHWQSDDAEAIVIADAGVTLGFLIDTRLQAALHARTSHQPRRSGAKETGVKDKTQ